MGKSSRQSFAARGRRNKIQSVFPEDMRLGKNTSQSASVRAKRVRRRGLHPSQKNACIFLKNFYSMAMRRPASTAGWALGRFRVSTPLL